MTTIYWFRDDYRLRDNPALLGALDSDEQVIMMVTARPGTEATRWGFERTSALRKAYTGQAVSALARQIRNMGKELWQPESAGVEGLIEFARAANVSRVVTQEIPAPEETGQVQTLRDAGIIVDTVWQSTLIHPDDLPFSVRDLPLVFTGFRNKVEHAGPVVAHPLPFPDHLNSPDPAAMSQLPAIAYLAAEQSNRTLSKNPPESGGIEFHKPQWAASEAAGIDHLRRYFSSDLPGTYKETRNELHSVESSTKFSGWLSVGAISARLIWQFLKEHESRRGANPSTYWIGFELLWRDYFRFLMLRHGARLFHRCGLQARGSSAANAEPDGEQRFNQWLSGQTGQPLIDAGMRELRKTGYLSNRMRQIVASYLVHDLRCDWRAGAAWFEHCLIDFDVCSNQGNWSYIAGVGTDPRGGRRFNPIKQTEQYDPHGLYRQTWSNA